MLNELTKEAQYISLESAAGDSGLLKATSRLPNYLSKVGHFLNDKIFQPIKNFTGSKDLGWIALNAGRYSYPDWRGFRMESPAGFRGSFAEYGKDLVQATELMKNLEKDVLAPYMTFISERLNDPSSLKSQNTNIKVPGMIDTKYSGIAKKIDGYFPNKSVNDEPIYSELIRRQSDWAEINNSVKQLTAYYSDGHYEAVAKRTQELSELINVLVDRLPNDKDNYATSSVVVNALSNVTLAVAQQVEFYGIVRGRVAEYCEAVDASVSQVRQQAGL